MIVAVMPVRRIVIGVMVVMVVMLVSRSSVITIFKIVIGLGVIMLMIHLFQLFQMNFGYKIKS